MLDERRVFVNGQTVRAPKHPVNGSDRIEVRGRPSNAPTPALRPKFPVIYEDDDVLVVDKPPGLLTSTNERERRPTLWAMVKDYVKSQNARFRPGLIHRLDRDASGLLIFSKNDAAYDSLKSQFYHHTVERFYTAVVHGVPDPSQGMIESRLTERTDGSVHATRQHGKGERAATEYTTIRHERRRSLLRVKLHTGRKHQIRAHLSERGWPIVGDRMYGPQPPAAPRLMLVATELAFDHPRTGQRVRLEIPIPRDLSYASK
jgi:23S rRNA pseudouridine1911/1915/1917 synthase